MNNQVKQTTPIPLLKQDGTLTQPSYAVCDLYQYNKCNIAAKGRIKEWEFYQLNCEKYVLQLTYGHVTYAANVAVNLIDLTNNQRYSYSFFKLFPKGKFALDFTSGQSHNVTFNHNGALLNFINQGEHRTITFTKPDEGTDISLTLPNEGDAMCYCIPFGNKRFYYNYKKLFASVSGKVNVKGRQYSLSNAYCIVDSGRGVWPYTHQWLWGMAQGEVEGMKVGFDLGYSNVDKGSTNENTFFVNCRQYKLGKITITTQKDYMLPWHFEEEHGRLSLTLTPIYDNYTQTNYLIVHNKCHQVFGYYDGFIISEEGNKLPISRMFGFCEHAVNRW